MTFSSCVPTSETYYKVVSGGADEIVQNYCRGTTPVGPYGTAIFNAHDNVSIEITSHIRRKTSSLSIVVVLKVPAGINTKLKDNNFIIKDFSSSKITKIEIPYIFHYIGHRSYKGYWDEENRMKRPTSSTLEGETKIIGNRFFGRTKIHKQYYIIAELGEYFPEKFQIVMPKLEINGKVYKFPDIIFFKERGTFVYPLNC